MRRSADRPARCPADRSGLLASTHAQRAFLASGEVVFTSWRKWQVASRTLAAIRSSRSVPLVSPVQFAATMMPPTST